MKIAILGLGVIGTTYAYAFQKAGHQVEHVLRDSKKSTAPKELSVDLLDGRYHSKGENKHDTYEVHVAEADSEYDFIFLSVRHGFVKEAVETLRKNNIKGTLVFFCNFYCCQSVYHTGQELGVKMPILEANMKGISI